MDMIRQKFISPDDIAMTISGPKTSLSFCEAWPIFTQWCSLWLFLCLRSHYFYYHLDVTSLCIAIGQNVIAPLLFSLEESTVDGCHMILLTESIYRGAFGSWPSERHQHDEIRTPVASFSSCIDLFMGQPVCSTTQSVQTVCRKYSLKLWRELCCCSLGFHWVVSFF